MEQKCTCPSCILEGVWANQREFNKNFIDIEKMSDEEKVAQMKEYILQLIGETNELLRETNYKNHRKANKQIIKSNMLEEWIDVFKYWLSIGQLWGFTPQDMIREYYRKSAVVEQRYKQELQLDFESSKIAGIDIDGVLAAYPEHFIDFVNKEMGTDINYKDITEYNLYKALPFPSEVVAELKDKFRQTGEKKHIPVITGAKEFLTELKKQGYKIVLLSARPYKQYRRIFADTQEWLNKNELVHDAILWDEDKCNRLIREFGVDNISFFVEDNIENANDIAKIADVYLLNRSYNQGQTHSKVIRVDSLKEILEWEHMLEKEGEWPDPLDCFDEF